MKTLLAIVLFFFVPIISLYIIKTYDLIEGEKSILTITAILTEAGLVLFALSNENK